LLDAAFAHDEWIGIKQKLVALVALGFAAVFDAVPFSGFGMMTRFVACTVAARAIRTVAFLLTVLPNPRPLCYAGRFPPVPDTVAEIPAHRLRQDAQRRRLQRPHHQRPRGHIHRRLLRL
jgi:hypothetical protein